MILSTNITDFASGALGMVELAQSYLGDRQGAEWSKAEIINYLNREQETLATVINEIYETFFVSSATTTTVANQSTYALPSDLVHLMGIDVGDSVGDEDGQKLTEVHFTDRNFYTRLQAVNEKRSFGFFFVTGQQLRLTPKDAGGGKTMRIFYVERLDDMVVDGDTSRIPVQHHECLCMGAARRARIKTGERNMVLETMYSERVELLKMDVRKFSPQRVETATPFWGSDQFPAASIIE